MKKRSEKPSRPSMNHTSARSTPSTSNDPNEAAGPRRRPVPESGGPRLPGGDAIQAGEVVHAEVASRVLDQTLAPHPDQFGADHGARRADEFGQVLVAQADVNRVAVSAALALEADDVPERGGHPGPGSAW